MCEISASPVLCMHCMQTITHNKLTVRCKNNKCRYTTGAISQEPEFPACRQCFIPLLAGIKNQGPPSSCADIFNTEIDLFINSHKVRYKAPPEYGSDGGGSNDDDNSDERSLAALSRKYRGEFEHIFGSAEINYLHPYDLDPTLKPENQLRSLAAIVLNKECDKEDSQKLLADWYVKARRIVPSEIPPADRLCLVGDDNEWEYVSEDDTYNDSFTCDTDSQEACDTDFSNNEGEAVDNQDCWPNKHTGKYPSIVASAEFLRHLTPSSRRFYIDALLQDPEFLPYHVDLKKRKSEDDEIQRLIRYEKYDAHVEKARSRQKALKGSLSQTTASKLDDILSGKASPASLKGVIMLGMNDEEAKNSNATAIASLLFGLEEIPKLADGGPLAHSDDDTSSALLSNDPSMKDHPNGNAVDHGFKTKKFGSAMSTSSQCVRS
ncbi:hypothetical protein Cpir12675_004299 [Ceratocystis pirilliformis]|uniref:Uncharacterized protein n=1 Tax=Ceratocystis pirilliformis TaxID=259994 RepID=A0ABR3YXE9_9PEZI